MGDVGLFGPHSVTWRLHADPLMGLATLRALLLRDLHPVAVAAESQRSAVHDDTWGRVRRTTDYVGVTTYGTTHEALLAGARVRAVHATVAGTEPGTGRTFQGDDEALLLWDHCCLVDSVLDVVRRGGHPLADDDADTYVAEQVRAAALVGLEPDVAPSTAAALAEHLHRTRPELAVTPQAREAAMDVLVPRPSAGVPARPAWAGVAGLAFAALPAWARATYALPELPGAAGLSESATTVALRALRAGLSGATAIVPPLREPQPLRDGRAFLPSRNDDRS